MHLVHRPPPTRLVGARERALGWVSRFPIPGSARPADEAAEYWTRGDGDQWRADSHWRSTRVYDEDAWLRIGRDHLDLLRSMAGGRDPHDWRRVVDWGAGGGANAIHFAPLAQEYIAVDLSDRTLAECRTQVERVASTDVRTLTVDADDPEPAVAHLEGSCDLFLCMYVLELVPSPEYGLRLMRIAHRLLSPGGIAFVQIKYQTRDRQTLPRRAFYRRNVANMTSYRIEEFWTRMVELGFTPHAIHLVPRNELDERYAYFVLGRPSTLPGA